VVGGTAARNGRVPLGKMLVVGQVAISLVLLIVAGLFVHSFAKLTQVNLGFDREHLLLFSVDPINAGYNRPAILPLYKDLLTRIAAVPGVRGVTLSHNGLFSGSESGDQIKIDGYTPKAGQEMSARFDHVGPNYFSTVGIPVLMGREIGPEDEGNGQRVGLINQTMARYYFGDESPIGRRIWDTFPTSYTDFTVVGVVGDAKYNQVNEKTPRRFYVPVFQPIDPSEVRFARFEVRAAGDPSTIAASVREVVKQTAPALPAIKLETMDSLVSQSLTSDRMVTKLSGFFGALAALLACIGLYGIMAYAVASRVNEIGIRMALGAQSENVRCLILRESLLLVGIGCAIGLPTVAGTSKLISSLLFGLTPADPIAIVAATALMFAVASLAAYVPAWRASRIDPLVALRYE
jgi:predicted permease